MAQRQRRRAEGAVHRRQVDEGQLQQEQHADGQPDRPVGEQQVETQAGGGQEAGVEEVEGLGDDQRVDGHGAGQVDRHAECQLDFEHGDGGAADEHRDDGQADDESAVEDRRSRLARRAPHDPRFGRFEGQGHGQGDGDDHVHPQDLHRGQRQGQPEQDRHQHHEALAAVGRQDEQDGFLQVVVDGPAFLDGTFDRREIVVGEDDFGGFLGRFGALDAHRHADVGAFQCRRVVDAVAGHGDDLAVGLQRGDDAQLVLGAGAGKDVAVADDAAQRVVVGGFQFGTGDDLERIGRADAHLDADGAGGAGVVAGDHLDPDAGTVTRGDGLDGLRSRRVDDADQAEENHAAVEVVDVQMLATVVHGAGSGGEHAQAFLAEPVDLVLPVGAVERLRCAVGAQFFGAAVEQAVGRALQQDTAQAGRGVGQRRHEFVDRLEGNGRMPGVPVGRESGLVRQCAQRAFGRFAGHSPLAAVLGDVGVVGDGDDFDQRVQVRVPGQFDQLPVERDLALRRVAGAADQVVAGAGDDVAGGHLVLGQRAGLVRADDGHRTQRFDRGELAGDRVAAGHTLHAEGQRDGQDGRQAFGNGGDGEADGGEEDFAEREGMQTDADRDHQCSEADDDRRQLLAELRHLAGQRRLQGFDFGDQAVDAADLGVRAGGGDHAQAPASGNQGAGIGHAEAVADAGVGGDRVGALVAGHRFAGQCRFLDAQVGCFEQTQVGRDPVARFQADDVTRHQAVGVDLRPLALAPDLGAGRQHLADAGQGFLGLAFLDEADDRVDDDDADDDAGVDPVPEQRGDAGGDQQDVDEDVVEVLEEALEQAVSRRRGEAVGTGFGETAGGFLRTQAVGVGGQVGEDPVGVQGVGRGTMWRGHGASGNAYWQVPSAARVRMMRTQSRSDWW